GIRGFHVTGVQTCALPIYRQRRGPGRLVRVLDPAGRWVDHARQLLEREDVRPEPARAVTRQNTLPAAEIAGSAPRHRTVEQVHDPALGVRIDDGEHRELQL